MKKSQVFSIVTNVCAGVVAAISLIMVGVYKKRNTALMTENRSKTGPIEQLNQALRDLGTTVDVIRQKIDTPNEKNEMLEAQENMNGYKELCEEKQKVIDLLNRKAEGLCAQNEELNAKIETLNGELNAKIETLNEELEKKRQEIITLTNAEVQLSETINNLKTKITTLETECGTVREKDTELRKKDEEMEKLARHYTWLQNQTKANWKALKEKCSELEAKITELSGEKYRLETENFQARTRIENLKRTNEELNKNLEKRDKNIEELETENTELCSKREDLLKRICQLEADQKKLNQTITKQKNK